MNRQFSIFLFFILFSVNFSCLNNSIDESCKFDIKDYLNLDTSKFHPIESVHNDYRIFDERKDDYFGGIYAFNKKGNIENYRFYVDTNLFTFEENYSDDSFYNKKSPLVYFTTQTGKDGKAVVLLFYYFP